MIEPKDLYRWCSVQADELEGHPGRRAPFKLVEDSAAMGEMMAAELVAEIEQAAAAGRVLRAILPCGPKCWYAPFARMVNEKNLNLAALEVFHMDECLDWEGKPLAENDPYNFKTFMLGYFYAPVRPELQVPAVQRHFLEPATMEQVRTDIAKAPIDFTLGGWGQDGHIAYNQARRHPYSRLTLEQLRNASMRIQDNNTDTIITLAQRSFGAAWQFVPPMSITLGVKECLSAKKVRLYSDTGSWKQTALRVALFSQPDVEYPMTLLQEHPDACIIATRETATHPISQNPGWAFKGVNA